MSEQGPKPVTIECNVDRCTKPLKARGLCANHYYRLMKYGSPHVTASTKKGAVMRWVNDLLKRVEDDCVLWPFSKSGNGYGCAVWNGKRVQASRLVLMLFSGEEGDGLHALHGDCHNKLCVNPRHLYWGTRRQNMLDKRRDGTDLSGSGSPFAKLSGNQVLEIRERYEAGGVTYGQLSAKFGVSETTILQAVKRRTYRDV